MATDLRSKFEWHSVTVELDIPKRVIKVDNHVESPQSITWFKRSIGIYVLESSQNVSVNLAEPYIELDFIPKLVTYSPRSTFSPLAILGRNNPLYHFGGSEDTLSFEIDWYLHAWDSKDSVLRKCRKIEALSKADGTTTPPLIFIRWGEGDNTIFKDHLFIVVSAKYELTTFIKNTDKNNRLEPLYAKQMVTLKRVTDHSLTHEEIIGDD